MGRHRTNFSWLLRALGISLPPDAVKGRKPGHIFDQRWHVGYVWGTAHGEEYLEVPAQHRMTNDRHFRVFTSGRVEDLPAPAEFFSYGPEATEEEKAQAERDYVEYNRQINAELRERRCCLRSEGTYPGSRSTSTSVPAAPSIATSDR